MARRKSKKPPVVQEDREQDLLFQEVSDELKQEKFAELWKAYGKYLIGGVAAIVIAVAGWRYWQTQEISAREASGERFAGALRLVQAGKTKEAAAAFGTIAKDGSRGYASLARLHEAALRAERGDRDGAIRIYQALAEAGDAKVDLRNLALILWAFHSVDTAEPAQMTERLRPLTEATSPWRFSALEVTALLAQRAGKHKKAREIFDRLAKDAAAPATTRARAREMLSILGGG